MLVGIPWAPTDLGVLIGNPWAPTDLGMVIEIPWIPTDLGGLIGILWAPTDLGGLIGILWTPTDLEELIGILWVPTDPEVLIGIPWVLTDRGVPIGILCACSTALPPGLHAVNCSTPGVVQMKARGAAVAVTHQKCPIFLPAQELLFHGRGYWAIFAPHPQAKHSTGQQGCAVHRRRW